MTGWMQENDARHIPEDELHAYLDQALSRSQCVEIECHLAECRRCQIERDRAAAVRDRTTALLAESAPRRIHAPPQFAALVARHEARVAARRTWVVRARRIALAAGVLAAVGAGWLSRGWLQTPATTIVAAADSVVVPERTLVAAGPVQLIAADTATTDAPHTESLSPVTPVGTRPQTRLARQAPAAAQLSAEVTVLSSDEETAALPGLWYQLDWQQAQAETGDNLARVEGLPILDIQVQRASNGERPLVVISQKHPSGRVIRTVEGPIDRVQDLVDREAARGSGLVKASVPSLTQPDYLGDGTTATRRGLRILTVLGAMAPDSLNALAKSIELRQ